MRPCFCFPTQIHKGETMLQAAFCAMARRIAEEGQLQQTELNSLRLDLAAENAFGVFVDTMRSNAVDADAREVTRVLAMRFPQYRASARSWVSFNVWLQTAFAGSVRRYGCTLPVGGDPYVGPQLGSLAHSGHLHPRGQRSLLFALRMSLRRPLGSIEATT